MNEDYVIPSIFAVGVIGCGLLIMSVVFQKTPESPIGDKWIRISESRCMHTSKMKVENGWLYLQANGDEVGSICFVPDIACERS